MDTPTPSLWDFKSSISEATGDDFELWKSFIRDNHLSFINVGLTKHIFEQAMIDPTPLLKHTTIESLNCSMTYDVFSTPKLFLLDKNKYFRLKTPDFFANCLLPTEYWL